MKAYIFILALVISYTVDAQSSWKPLGPNGGLVSETSSARSVHPSIATDSSGTPYIAYDEASDSLKIIIKKYNGINWVNVGTPSYNFRGRNVSIAISNKDTIYVGYLNKNDSEKPTVIKYDGTNWVLVGSPIAYGGGGLYEVSLTIDNNDKLYFGYAAFDFPGTPIGKANIMTFDGIDWVPVGNTDFVQYTSRISLRIGLNDQLYVGYNTIYKDNNNSKGWVQKWNGVQWDTVGTGLNGGLLNIDIAPDGSLYCLSGYVTGGYPVNKLVNNNWVQLGNSGVSGIPWKFALDKQGFPHIPFTESNGSGGQISIKKFDGNSWYYLGKKTFTNHSSTSEARMVFDNKNLPIITYQTNTTLNEQVFSWYYDSVTTNIDNIEKANTIVVFPNPVRSTEDVKINIQNLPSDTYRLRIFNFLGQEVFGDYFNVTNTTSASTVSLPHSIKAGICHIQLQSKQFSQTLPLIVYE